MVDTAPPEEPGFCHFCKAKAEPDVFCYGCHYYVCSDCDPGFNFLPRVHDVADHEQSGEEGDEIDRQMGIPSSWGYSD